eukprot:Opistho-2@73140
MSDRVTAFVNRNIAERLKRVFVGDVGNVCVCVCLRVSVIAECSQPNAATTHAHNRKTALFLRLQACVWETDSSKHGRHLVKKRRIGRWLTTTTTTSATTQPHV